MDFPTSFNRENAVKLLSAIRKVKVRSDIVFEYTQCLKEGQESNRNKAFDHRFDQYCLTRTKYH